MANNNKVNFKKSRKNSSNGSKKPFESRSYIEEGKIKETGEDIGKGKSSMHNGVEEYISDSTIRSQVANLYQRNPIGKLTSRFVYNDFNLMYNQSDPGALESAATMQYMPAILKFKVFQGIGNASDATDAINQAGNRLTGMMRKLNSNNMPYAKADVMMFIEAYASIYNIMCHTQRMARLTSNYSSNNIYTPDGILQAISRNSQFGSDFRSHAADYMARFNTISSKAQLLNVPSEVFQIVKRQSTTVTQIFSDDPDDWTRGQIYVCVPEGYYVWDDTTDPNGSMLEFRPLHAGNGSYTFGDLLDILDTQLDALLTSSSAWQINSDINKCWKGAVYTFPTNMTATEFVTPVYDYDMLMQLKNSFILGDSAMAARIPGSLSKLWDTRDIKQDASHNLIVAKPYFVTSCSVHNDPNVTAPVEIANAATTERCIDLGPKGATEEQILYWTHYQYTPVVQDFDSDFANMTVYLNQFGSQVICGCELWYNHPTNQGDPTGEWFDWITFSSIMGVNRDGTNYHDDTCDDFMLSGKVVAFLGLLRQFKFAPAVTFISYLFNDYNCFSYAGEVFDTDVWYYLPHTIVDNIQYQVILNQWGVSGDKTSLPG